MGDSWWVSLVGVGGDGGGRCGIYRVDDGGSWLRGVAGSWRWTCVDGHARMMAMSGVMVVLTAVRSSKVNGSLLKLG